ncbi:MAG: hypothetical protein V4651_06555 [Bacteroidota bacterium]
MKKIVCMLTLLLLNAFLFAQEVDLKWATEEKVAGKSASPEFLGIRNEKIYVIKSENVKKANSYYIDVYDAASLEEGEKIDFAKALPKDIADNELYNVYLLDTKLIIITTTKNKELLATSLDLDGKVLKGKITLDRVDGKDKEFEGFEVRVSPDRSKILGFRKAKGKVKKTIAFNFSLYDQELKRLNEKKTELPYEDENFKFGTISVDNKGDVFGVAVIKIEGKRKKFDTQKAVLMNLDLSKSKPEINEVNLPFEKRIASSMSFMMDDSKITVAGMYANNKDAEFLEGIFYIELNKTNFEVLQSNYEKFKPGMQTRKINSNKMDNNVGFGYDLKDIHVNSKGEKFLTFENTLIAFQSSKNGTSKYVILTDIIVAKLSETNKLQWNSIINKNQVLRIPYTSTVGMGAISITVSVYKFYKKFEDLLSYTVLYKNDDMYFLFNDNNKNEKTKNTDKPFNSFKKAYSALVKLDMDKGKWEKKTIFSTKEMGRMITPNNSVQISDNKILTFSYYKKGSSIGYLTIE